MSKRDRRAQRRARGRPYDPCGPAPRAGPARLVPQSPDELHTPARQVTDDPAAGKPFRKATLLLQGTVPNKAPTATDPALEIGRVVLPLGRGLLLTRWGQHMRALRPGQPQAPIGDPTTYWTGTDIAVQWFLVAFNRNIGVGSTLATSLEPVGSMPLYQENGTTEIVSTATKPRPIPVALAGPITMLFAIRFAAGTSVPSANVAELGGFLEGYTFDNTGGRVGPDAQFIGRLAASAGGG